MEMGLKVPDWRDMKNERMCQRHWEVKWLQMDFQNPEWHSVNRPPPSHVWPASWLLTFSALESDWNFYLCGGWQPLWVLRQRHFPFSISSYFPFCICHCVREDLSIPDTWDQITDKSSTTKRTISKMTLLTYTVLQAFGRSDRGHYGYGFWLFSQNSAVILGQNRVRVGLAIRWTSYRNVSHNEYSLIVSK